LANRQKEIYAWAQTRKVAPGPTTQPPDVTIVPHHHFVHGNFQVAVKIINIVFNYCMGYPVKIQRNAKILI
jgi:hypothetical protein